MTPKIVSVEYVDAYLLRVRFEDGAEGELDMAGELDGVVFEPLRDRSVFRQCHLDPATRTLSWPNGADLAPEFVRARISVTA